MTPETMPSFPPSAGRTHEICGAGAHFFAFALAGQSSGQVVWAREDWRPDRLNPSGFSSFLDPGRLLVVSAGNQTDVLAATEEALRFGAVAMVIAELSQPLGLTAGRRLQLAARAGKATGLCIIPEGMGSNAAETRWRCSPVFSTDDSTLQLWELIKNKSGTLGDWYVRWGSASRRLYVVSQAGQRPGFEGVSG